MSAVLPRNALCSTPPSLPALPPGLHQARGWFWRTLGRTYLRLAGWRFEGAFPR